MATSVIDFSQYNLRGPRFNRERLVTDPRYGADDTGVNDATGPVLDAIGDLQNGESLVFTPGRYRIASNVSLLLAGLERIGIIGHGAVIETAEGAHVRTMVVRSCNDVTVRGLRFQTAASARGNGVPYEALCVQNSSEVKVRRSAFRHYNHIGVTVSEIVNGASAACDDITVEHCDFESCGTFGYQHFPKVLSRNAFFLRNRLVNCGLNPFGGSDPVTVKAGQATRNFIAQGNIVEGGRTAFGVINWESATFDGNELYDCDGYAFSINTEIHTKYTASFLKAVIKNNVGRWSQDFVPTKDYAAIYLTGDHHTDNGPIDIEDNHFHGWGCPYELRPKVAVPNVSFRRGKFVDCRSSALCDDTRGAAPAAPVFDDVEFVNTDAARTIDARVYANGARVRRCLFNGYGERPLRLLGNVTAEENKFRNNNPSGASTNRGAIYLAGPGTYTLKRNEVEDPNDSGVNRLSHLVEDAGATAIIEEGNRATRALTLANVTTAITPAAVGSGWVSRGGRRVYGANARPTSGSYMIGDYVENTAPAITGAAGSRYVVQGWRRLTTGATHVLNTDWAEDRAPTGT